MKTSLVLVIISLLSFLSFSKKEKEELKIEGKLKTIEGEFIDMYGEMSILDNSRVQYQDVKGKYRTIPESKTEWVYWGGHAWFMVDGKEKGSRFFMELMAMNENCKLFYAPCSEPCIDQFFNIINIQNNLDEKLIHIKWKNSFKNPGFNPDANDEAFKKIKNYFPDCPELLTELESQIAKKTNLHCKSYISCDGAQDLKSLLK